MSTTSKEVVLRFFEAYGRQDLESAANLVTEDFVNNSSTSQGRDGVREEGQF
ncbi:MAG TPA: nuclear transport factor 2 family protein [Acidimicrobiia bacterium]|nr:nuclear transport factor 2 family protein [Acidimicrobiia bacterium]